MLLRDAVLLAGLGVAGGKHDHATDAGARAVHHNLLDCLACGGDNGAVGHLGQRRDIGIAALFADPLVACVHRIDPAAIVAEIVQHALAE